MSAVRYVDRAVAEMVPDTVHTSSTQLRRALAALTVEQLGQLGS